MNKKTIWEVVAVVVVIILIIWAAQSSTHSNKTVRIGVSTLITGSGAFIGESITTGLKVAAAEINNAGGINGKPIELIFEDNKNTGQDGVSAFRALQTKGVDFVVTSGSAPSIAAADIAKASGIPELTTAVFADVLAKDDNAVSFFPTPADDAAATVQDMVKNKISNVAVIYLNSEYGVSALNAFLTEAKKNNITIVDQEAYSGDTTDFATPVTKALSYKPQAVHVLTINSVPVIKQIKNTKNNAVIYSNLIPVFGNLIYNSPGTFDGVHLTALRASIAGTPEFTDLRNKMSGVAKIENNTFGYSAVAYDDLYLISDVLKKAGNVKDFVPTFTSYGDFKGINGDFNINGRGIGMKVYPVIFNQGALVEVK